MTTIFNRIGPDVNQYIFEVIVNGELVGLVIDENGSLYTIASDDERFLHRLVIEND